MTTTGWRTFQLSDPLPEGMLCLEASAGTGKTYTIEGLVTRLVAEDGVPIDKLLVVTFTEEATSELRGRIRRRLALGLQGLEAVRDGAEPK
ncbi:MAG: UvrD-helicase domain-containing protein, partial [Myxococcota bacterium]|nr:UvrD-helicase domain-containing protein [Myxococcota bacterium]